VWRARRALQHCRRGAAVDARAGARRRVHARRARRLGGRLRLARRDDGAWGGDESGGVHGRRRRNPGGVDGGVLLRPWQRGRWRHGRGQTRRPGEMRVRVVPVVIALLVAGAGRASAQVETVASFNPSLLETPENIAIDTANDKYVSLALTGEIR